LSPIFRSFLFYLGIAAGLWFMHHIIFSFVGRRRGIVVILFEYLAFSLFATDVPLKMDFDMVCKVLIIDLSIVS
jgi:hypothetical protein